MGGNLLGEVAKIVYKDAAKRRVAIKTETDNADYYIYCPNIAKCGWSGIGKVGSKCPLCGKKTQPDDIG